MLYSVTRHCPYICESIYRGNAFEKCLPRSSTNFECAMRSVPCSQGCGTRHPYSHRNNRAFYRKQQISARATLAALLLWKLQGLLRQARCPQAPLLASSLIFFFDLRMPLHVRSCFLEAIQPRWRLISQLPSRTRQVFSRLAIRKAARLAMMLYYCALMRHVLKQRPLSALVVKAKGAVAYSGRYEIDKTALSALQVWSIVSKRFERVSKIPAQEA